MKEKIIKAEINNLVLFEFEQGYWKEKKLICGIDEVGRGCLAGPIVTASVILNNGATHLKIKDSKMMPPLQLEIIYEWILKNSFYSIGISNNRIIDQENIYKATQKTMKKSLLGLLQLTSATPDIIVIDAMPLNLNGTPYENIPITSWTQGESKSASIAAASIVAKVTRDRIMKKMHSSFPSYGLDQHKGYGTALHINKLRELKASIIHRKTFIKNFKESNHENTGQQNLFC